MNYGWLALAGIVANILLYFLAIFSSHIAAFGTLYDLKVLFADHITKSLWGIILQSAVGAYGKSWTKILKVWKVLLPISFRIL